MSGFRMGPTSPMASTPPAAKFRTINVIVVANGYGAICDGGEQTHVFSNATALFEFLGERLQAPGVAPASSATETKNLN